MHRADRAQLDSGQELTLFPFRPAFHLALVLEARPQGSTMGGDLLRLAWYTAVLAILLVLAVAVVVYITVVIAAMGRQIDKVGEALVREEAAAILEPLRSQLKPEKYREMYNALVE